MIQQYIENPQLLESLTPQQKTQVYQDLLKYLQSLQTQKTKAETQLQIKQQEQQEIFQKLQAETNLQTLQEIQNHIQNLQNEFDQQLLEITKSLQETL